MSRINDGILKSIIGKYVVKTFPSIKFCHVKEIIGIDEEDMFCMAELLITYKENEDNNLENSTLRRIIEFSIKENEFGMYEINGYKNIIIIR